MKKFITVLFFTSLLFCSCSHDKGNTLKNYFTVSAEADGFRIKTVCESAYNKNIIEVYDETEQHNNLAVVNLAQSAEFLYPYVSAGKEYTITFRIKDINNNLQTAYILSNVTSAGGKGDFYVTESGISYDGNQTLKVMDYDFHSPVTIETGGNSPVNASVSFISPDKTTRVTPDQHSAFDYKNGVFTIDKNLIENSPYGYMDFTVYFNFHFFFEDNLFIYESGRGIVNTLGKPSSTAWTKDNYLTVTSNSEGFKFQKYFDEKNPNVRIKVFNETENHYCPTVKLDEYYYDIKYDYLNPGDYYTVEIQCWDSNWNNYNSRKIQHIKSYGGTGDCYFINNGFEYEQGEPDTSTAIIHLKNAEFIKGPDSYSVSGNIWYFDENGKHNAWNTFSSNYDSLNKDLAIDIHSELKKIRGKSFYTELSANWNKEKLSFELGLINNQNELERFKDTHVAFVNHIENDFTILEEAGKCIVSENLQSKRAYLIKYNKSAGLLEDKSPVYTIAHASELLNRNAVETQNKTGWTDAVYYTDDDKGILSGTAVNRNSRNADSEEIYKIGQTKQFNEGKATLKAVSDYCYVWYCNNNNEADKLLNETIAKGETSFEEVARRFDSIYKIETGIIGSKVPEQKWSNIIKVNETDKVNIFIFDIDNDYTKKQSGGTLGYFHGKDFFINNNQSNQCEIIYIDSGFLGKIPKKLYSTLTHEFQHLLLYVNKGLNKNKGIPSWFTEMMSLGTEIALQTKCLGYENYEAIDFRISEFNGGYHYGFENWNIEELSGYNYANAAVFMDYLMKNYGGVALLKEIAANDYADEEAINIALKKAGYSETFDTVMMKMGKMIVNSYDKNPETNDLSLNKEYTFDVEVNGKTESFNFKALDITAFGHYIPNKDYSADSRLFDLYKGPAILKATANYKKTYSKAIAVYELSDNCGAELNIENPGEGYDLALYFK